MEIDKELVFNVLIAGWLIVAFGYAYFMFHLSYRYIKKLKGE